jgi:crotonobetainyl-CoA:carnitine CoA-transferase CaiB-like acyl-CoA transferase
VFLLVLFVVGLLQVNGFNCLERIAVEVPASAHGADVLLVTSPNLPDLPLLDIETSRGKRTTQLDLTLPSDRKILASLVADSDVFLQAYRPGGLQEKGFGAEDIAKVRPGILYAGLTAYGWDGPWKDRRGVRFTGLGTYFTFS